ncbi:MAG: 2'-5' RNA ligase family protein [Promethearchaeota archaeon]
MFHRLLGKLYQVFTIEFSGLTTFPATHVFYLNSKYLYQLDQLKRTCLDILQQKGIDLKHDPDSMWNPHLTLSLDLPTKNISKKTEFHEN